MAHRRRWWVPYPALGPTGVTHEDILKLHFINPSPKQVPAPEGLGAKPHRRDFMTWSGLVNLSAAQRQEQ